MALRQQHTPGDWALLFGLVVMWGSTFLCNKLGVATISPLTLVAARLSVGALTLLALLVSIGVRLPPLGRVWLSYLVLGIIGNALPFYLITWGQQVVDSAVAGIFMAVMPLATLVLAHFAVRGEEITTARLVGFGLGFAGIVLLMDPTALLDVGGAAREVAAQLAILGAALCYAANSVLARLLVREAFLSAAAGTLLVSAVCVVPLAVALDAPWTNDPSAVSIAAAAWLGIGPTAIATIIYYRLISSAGPTFMSLVNYLIPAVAVFLGVSLLGEEPGVNAYAGLACILCGIAVSQTRRR